MLSNTAADRIAAPSSASATIGRGKKERRRGAVKRPLVSQSAAAFPLLPPSPLLEDLFSQDGDREQEEIDRVTYITHPGDRAL